MVPPVGIEPTTTSLPRMCSTTEPRRLKEHGDGIISDMKNQRSKITNVLNEHFKVEYLSYGRLYRRTLLGA